MIAEDRMMELVLGTGADMTGEEHDDWTKLLEAADYVPVINIWLPWSHVPSSQVLCAEEWMAWVRRGLFHEREAIIHDGWVWMPCDELPEGFEAERSTDPKKACSGQGSCLITVALNGAANISINGA